MSQEKLAGGVSGTLPTFHEDITSTDNANASRNGKLKGLFYIFLVLFAPWAFFRHLTPHSPHHGGDRTTTAQCTQVDPLFPTQKSSSLDDMDASFSSVAFQNLSVKRLSGAVQIPTMSFDDMGPIGEDKRWDIFYDFAAYLKKTFPVVHENLDLELVNTHGLVYTWKGSDSSLKPTLLMAHQDVVPVPDATIDAWTHPPFSGFFDGKYIWGRGAEDCKNQLIAILESVELLLAADFVPKRTVILSFGFDEEIGGREGASHLSKFILEKYGKDSIAVIVDEGATVSNAWGTLMAQPGVAEKGYTDVQITIRMPGGHSSIPPDHTSIGVMSELISLIEAHPYRTHLDEENPYLGKLQCGAAHSPNFPKKLRKLLHQSSSRNQCKAKPDHLALEAAKAGRDVKYLMQTSVAADVIGGGVKVNALPERVSAIVNHRINIGEKPSDVFEKITHLAEAVAKKYNLTLHAFDGTNEAASSISLVASPNTINVAPVTPTEVDHATPYAVLSGTTRALYGEEMIVAPGIMTGNTDTRYYWDLTRHIFRFAPGWADDDEGFGNIHTVNERQSIKSHVAAIRWFSLFVRNMDEAEL